MTDGNAVGHKPLQEAQNRVTEGERHVRRQRERIAGLERDGLDTSQAKHLLETLEDLLRRHIEERDRWKDNLLNQSSRA